jgi:hypothetical protein|tara:strand:- start:176 stop:415 length:240 start_codon:yes stop_codon:yes gene_type:complete
MTKKCRHLCHQLATTCHQLATLVASCKPYPVRVCGVLATIFHLFLKKVEEKKYTQKFFKTRGIGGKHDSVHAAGGLPRP